MLMVRIAPVSLGIFWPVCHKAYVCSSYSVQVRISNLEIICNPTYWSLHSSRSNIYTVQGTVTLNMTLAIKNIDK